MSYDIPVICDVCKHNLFNLRIKNKYVIERKGLFWEFLLILHNKSGMLCVHRREYLFTLSDEIMKVVNFQLCVNIVW